jgi:sn-glycerol 3-phosphate transport system substrate-binding protein
MGVWPKARTINSETSVSIINGDLSVEEGLTKMDEDVQAALEGYSGDYSGDS